jgi:(p)ppGpp synthase/HD superfamily hydrolase
VDVESYRASGPVSAAPTLSALRHPGSIDRDSARLEQAINFGCRAHRGQLYTSPDPQPFVLHLFRAMLAVDGHHARMAAMLHDVLEDTQATADDLHDAGFPRAVVDAVVVLSHRPQHTYEEYIELVAGNELAREVKVADLAHNLANNRRLPQTPDVVARIDRYERAVQRLLGDPASA